MQHRFRVPRLLSAAALLLGAGAGAAGAEPLAFEPNLGQTDAAVAYLSRTSDGLLFLAANEIVLRLDQTLPPADAGQPDLRAGHRPLQGRHHLVRIQPVGARAARLESDQELASRSGYQLKDRAIPEVPHFGRVAYRGIYPGTDLVLRGENGRFAYDFVLAPGADPAAIALRFDGAAAPAIAADGALELGTPLGALRQSAPFLYQEVGGRKVAVAGGFELRQGNLVGFRVGEYDRGRELVIDPTFSFITCIGRATGSTQANAIETTANGQAYIVGSTWATNLPTPGGDPYTAGQDAYVAKLDLAGNLSRATYFDLGGDESGLGIDLDATNSAVIAGSVTTQNPDGSYQIQAFAAKLSTLLDTVSWTKVFGGANPDGATDVAIDAGGNIFLAGNTESTDFCSSGPVTGKCVIKSTLSGPRDAFLVKLGANGGISWATLAGSPDWDNGTAVAVDDDGRPYLGGYGYIPGSGPVSTVYFPWIRRFTAAGTATQYTFEFAKTPTAANPTFSALFDLAVDALDNAYFVGATNSTALPVPGAVQSTLGGSTDAFAGMLNNSGSALVYDTYLGGSRSEWGNAIRVGDNSNAYLAGRCTGSTPADSWCTAGAGDTSVFVARYAAGGLSRVFYTPFGSSELEYAYGLALDSARNMYVAGFTYGPDFDGAGTSCDVASWSGGIAAAFVVKYP